MSRFNLVKRGCARVAAQSITVNLYHSTAVRAAERAEAPEAYAASSHESSFLYADLRIIRTQRPQPKPPLEDLKFGQTFTDHMLVASHSAESGWSAPEIRPFGPLLLHPAAQVLHYGASCFEGMKAFRGVDGRTRLFRPELNMQRLQSSAARLLLAPWDTQELLQCMAELLRLERDWIPDQMGYSMYIRPFVYSTGQSLGVSRSTASVLSILLSPVGPYFRSGLRPISLLLDEQHVRAWPRGVGQYKIGGNYAPTLLPQEQGLQLYDVPQVLYTLPARQSTHPDDAIISECGAMNVMMLLRKAGGSDRELVTPPLDGTILPGVTRTSILELAREWGEFDVSERPISIREIKQAAADGRLLEMFGCGTACLVQPIAVLKRSNGEQFAALATAGLGEGSADTSTARRLASAVQDIQYGRHPHPWGVVVE